VLSAVVPTAIAERWFLPDAAAERHEERRHAPVAAKEYVLHPRLVSTAQFSLARVPRNVSSDRRPLFYATYE
jgi:hypothetical protein